MRAVDPAADDAALRRLALWATRYTPAVSPWERGEAAPTDSSSISPARRISSAAKQKLLADLAQRLERFGLPARLAVADTRGRGLGAVALSWRADVRHSAVRDRKPTALAPLPIEALRLSPDTRTTLRRLGFKRVGALIDKPRAPFAARFETELLKRLDQALGRAAEPLALIVAAAGLSQPALSAGARSSRRKPSSRSRRRLMQDLVHALVRDGVGARTLAARALPRRRRRHDASTSASRCRRADVAHVARLIDLKLERSGIAEADRMPDSASRRSALRSRPSKRMEPQQTELDSVRRAPT